MLGVCEQSHVILSDLEPCLVVLRGFKLLSSFEERCMFTFQINCILNEIVSNVNSVQLKKLRITADG